MKKGIFIILCLFISSLIFVVCNNDDGEDLKLLGTWTLEKYECDRSIPLHPLLKLYYKERNGMPIFIEVIEWYNNRFKLWNDTKHNVFYHEKHKRYIIKDVES